MRGARCGFTLPLGWPSVLGLVLAALAAAPVRAAEAAPEPPPALELVHEDGLELEGFGLQSVEYVLDGAPLPGPPGGGGRHAVSSGQHVLALEVVYVGRSPVFAYLEGYRFTMRGRVTFEARPGWVVRIRSTGFAQKGLTVRWEQRPAFKLEGEPRRAILSIESGPVEREPLRGVDPHVPPEPSADAGEARAQQVIDEVLAEANRLAPPVERCELEPLYFDFADTRLKPEAEAALRRLSVCLLRQPALRLRIQGHCDVRGSKAFNDKLGLGRAQTVAGYLSSLGVQPSRFGLETRGAAQPACTERTPECFARSRRVELVVDPHVP